MFWHISGGETSRQPLHLQLSLALPGLRMTRTPRDLKGGKRNDGTPAFLASLALYVELRAYDNATAKGLFFGTLTHKPGGEADAANRGGRDSKAIVGPKQHRSA
ncbi:hypothetical protein ARMGADRAFT_1092880 [Armillaria gallica]|uniref:Uncharacterized protein n=1 Tax=Armillaria gallica TaxID=47427 RepID=A0A2H3CWL3_ARMGA|nr:hypothetical protein ARMGADRAFT_1092880 [Armillaria gallica]